MPTVYITAPPDAADGLAATLVEEQLAACVNQFPVDSTYRWDGDVHRDEECVLFAKTTERAYDALVAHVEELHPHEVPCIERFDEDAVLDAFAEWRSECCLEGE